MFWSTRLTDDDFLLMNDSTPNQASVARAAETKQDRPLLSAEVTAFLGGMDCIRGALLVADLTSRRIVFQNATARALFADIETPSDSARIDDLLVLMAAHNRGATLGDLRDALLPLSPSTGNSDPIELRLGPVQYELVCTHRQIVGVGWVLTAILRDISARMAQEAAQRDIISVVSHELRSPLASIRGSLQLLGSGALGAMPADALKVFEIALRNSEHMLSVVNEILEDESAKQKNALRTELIDLTDLLRDAIDTHGGFATQWAINLTCAVPAPGTARIMGNRYKLMQVLNNLISNAIKFSPKHSTITVGLAEQPQTWRVEVTDQGPGVPEEQRPQLFARFASTPVQTETKLASTGLGLSIARDIVDMHGGTIGFRDEKPGGTTFFFDLLKTDQDPQDAAQTANQCTGGRA